MSITQITIEIKRCYPLNFNFENFIFHFISEKIKLSKTIPYNFSKKIKHKFDLKIDTTYYIKAMTEGEIIGIANFFIPSNFLFKKAKSLTIPNIKFTMTDYHKKRFFNNKDKETTIELDLEIKFTHVPKQLTFKKISSRRNPCDLRIIHSDRKRNRPSINTPNKTALHSATNIGGYIHYKKAIDEQDSPRKPRVYSAQQSANTSINNILPSNSNESSAISFVDSVLNENECDVDYYDKDNISVIDNLCLNNISPNESNEIDLQREKVINNTQIRLNKNLMQVLNDKCKIIKAYNCCQDKRRELTKKINKLNQWKGKFEVKNNITVNINRSDNDYFNKLCDIKCKENEIFDVIFSNVLKKNKNESPPSQMKKQIKGTTFNKHQKHKESNLTSDKALLLKVIKKTLNINVDLNICFNFEGISKFRDICHKYHLIKDSTISNGVYYNNQIKEEEETEYE